MATENKDIKRVEDAGATLTASTLIAGQLGFENDGLFRLAHKMLDGTTVNYWSPDNGTASFSNITVDEYIYHADDTTNNIRFQSSQQTLNVGNIAFINMEEGAVDKVEIFDDLLIMNSTANTTTATGQLHFNHTSSTYVTKIYHDASNDFHILANPAGSGYKNIFHYDWSVNSLQGGVGINGNAADGSDIVLNGNLLSVADDTVVATFEGTNDMAMIKISSDDTDSYILSKDNKMQLGHTSTLATSNVTITTSGFMGIANTITPQVPLYVHGQAILGDAGTTVGGSLPSYEVVAASTDKPAIALFASMPSMGYIDIQGLGTHTYLISNAGTSQIGQTSTISTSNVTITSNSTMGIGTTAPTGDITLGKDGIMYMKEYATTPTAVASFGSIYTRSDNKLYFQDGAGVEHEVSLA